MLHSDGHPDCSATRAVDFYARRPLRANCLDLLSLAFSQNQRPLNSSPGPFCTAFPYRRGEADFRPYLHTVPPDFSSFSPLLAVLGVRPSFGASHFAAGLAAVAAAQAASAATAGGGVPLALDDTALATALQLADCLSEALQTQGGSVEGCWWRGGQLGWGLG